MTSLGAGFYTSVMNDKRPITQQDIDEASVRLRPVFGMAPRRYLPMLYGLALVLVAFFVLVFPGLSRPGVLWSFTVDPPGSALYIDGAYRGHAPCTVFVAAGQHAVEVSRPGFSASRLSINSKGRVFATLIVPPRAGTSISLVPLDGHSILADGMRQYASWALAGSPSEAYQLPMVLSDAARAASIDPAGLDGTALAGAALSYATHAQSLRDAVRAVSISYGASAAVTPVSLSRLVSALGAELREDPAMLAVFASLAPADTRARLQSSASYKTLLKAPVQAAVKSGPLSVVGEEEFIAMPGGTVLVQAGTPQATTLSVAPFLMASSETTVGRFRRFIAARPEWGPEAAARLAARGLAEPDYLEGFDTLGPDEVLRYVSRPAALAYCAWLSESAPKGYRFDLPDEVQWAYAAAASGSSASKNAVLAESGVSAPLSPSALPRDAAGLKGLLGNVWEWCADSYSSNPACGLAGRSLYPSAEALVRGASWANRSDLVSLASRGPVPEYECSAYVGFRVVLVPASEP